MNSAELPLTVFDAVSQEVIAVSDGAIKEFGPSAGASVGRRLSGTRAPTDRVRVVGRTQAGGAVLAARALSAGELLELGLLTDVETWNGRPAGLAMLYDPDEPDWSALRADDDTCLIAAAVIEAALEAVVVTDGRGVIHSTNSAAEVMFGRTSADLVGQGVETLMPTSTGRRDSDFMANALQRGIARDGQPRLFRVLHRDGHELEAAVSLTRLPVAPEMFCAVLRDVTYDRQKWARLEHLALTDQITGLSNRRSFEDWWAENPWRDAPIAVLLVELQRTSVLVEGFGREAADGVLSDIGGRLENAVMGKWRLGGSFSIRH